MYITLLLFYQTIGTTGRLIVRVLQWGGCYGGLGKFLYFFGKNNLILGHFDKN